MLKRSFISIYHRLSIQNRSVITAYAIAISNTMFILLAHNQLAHLIWNASPFLMFLPGIIFTSWYGGFLPGVVATLVATVVGDYFFLNPIYTFTIADSADIARIILFSTVGILISIINQTFYNQKREKEDLLNKLEQAEQQKTKFLSMVAHELRTPLTTAQLINDLLINKFQKMQAKREVADLENMHEELDSLSRLIQELFIFVRGEQGKLPLHRAKTTIQSLMQKIIENYQKAYPRLVFSYKGENDAYVYADEKRIKQVLYNLLDNAVKVSPEKGKIMLTLEKKEHMAIVTISDEGTGISQKERKYVFRQYYQAKNTRGHGFGLGLYIAKQIIERHKGKIWIAATGKNGTKFAFSLPIYAQGAS